MVRVDTLLCFLLHAVFNLSYPLCFVNYFFSFCYLFRYLFIFQTKFHPFYFNHRNYFDKVTDRSYLKKILYLSLSLLYDFISSPQVVLQEVLEDEKTYAFIFR